MRILLTGASGFVGSYVLRNLLESKHDVAILRRESSDLWRIGDLVSKVRHVVIGCGGIDGAAQEILAFKPEAVVHLAWDGVANFDRDNPKQIENVSFCAKLMDIAVESGCSVWVGLGSQAEYGPSRRDIDENAPTKPTTLYGITKLSAMMICRHLASAAGMRFVWLRLFSSYGPGDNAHWMIPYLILSLLRNKRPALTAGEQCWDYIYVEDAASAIATAVVNPGASGIFNLGSGSAPSLRSIVEQIRDLVDPNLTLGFGEVPYRSDQVMYLKADVRALQMAIGWSPSISLASGLQRTVEFYREHQSRFPE